MIGAGIFKRVSQGNGYSNFRHRTSQGPYSSSVRILRAQRLTWALGQHRHIFSPEETHFLRVGGRSAVPAPDRKQPWPACLHGSGKAHATMIRAKPGAPGSQRNSERTDPDLDGPGFFTCCTMIFCCLHGRSSPLPGIHGRAVTAVNIFAAEREDDAGQGGAAFIIPAAAVLPYAPCANESPVKASSVAAAPWLSRERSPPQSTE